MRTDIVSGSQKDLDKCNSEIKKIKIKLDIIEDNRNRDKEYLEFLDELAELYSVRDSIIDDLQAQTNL